MKTIYTPYLLAALAVLATGGCATKTDRLVFLDTNKFGISMTGSVPEQKTDFTVGYTSASFASVPAHHEDNGQVIAEAPTDGASGTNKDALSVFAHFGARANNNGGKQEVQIGRFFATGVAAQSLAAGYGAAAAASAGYEANGAAENTETPENQE